MGKKVILKAREGAMPGFPGFVGWLAATHPQLYSYVQASEPSTVMMLESRRSTGSLLSGDGDGDKPAPSAIQQLVTTVVQAGAQVLPLIQQQKVLKMQLERAKQGLPPLDVGAYIDPNAGFNVGVTPGTQKVLLWLGGGVVGAWLLSRILGRR